MLDKEYAVNMLTALVDSAEEMNGHGIKAKCLAVNDAVFDTIRGLITYLQNSEEVVRCKNCKHWVTVIDRKKAEYGLCDAIKTTIGAMPKDGFCYKGERREEI